MTSYEPQRTVTSTTSDKPPINLLRGWPHPSLLPTNLIRSAAQRALSDPSISTPGLLYGPDPGYQPLRQSVAKWLTDYYHGGTETQDEERAITPDRICITGGASQNLGSILNVYTNPSYTRCVWVVAPAYFLAFRIFEDAGLRMRAVREDEEGPDISYLRQEMKRMDFQAQQDRPESPKFQQHRPWAKIYKHIIYCVPTFANPSSKTTTLQRRKDLVALAREFDALVVCDDVYDFLQWPTKTTNTSSSTKVLQTAHLPRLVDLDRTLPAPNPNPFGNVCSNGSLSKIAGPGIRVGWCEGTPKFAYGVSQVGTTKSGGAPSQLTSTYINLLLESGQLQKHIRDVSVPAYGRRYAKMMGAIETELLPLGFERPQRNEAMWDVSGGYFTWLTLPSSLQVMDERLKTSPAEALAERCLSEENITIAPGKIFEVPGDNDREGVNFENSIRLCWSWEDEDNLAQGIERIAKVAGGMMQAAEDEGDSRGRISTGYVLVEKKSVRNG